MHARTDSGSKSSTHSDTNSNARANTRIEMQPQDGLTTRARSNTNPQAPPVPRQIPKPQSTTQSHHGRSSSKSDSVYGSSSGSSVSSTSKIRTYTRIDSSTDVSDLEVPSEVIKQEFEVPFAKLRSQIADNLYAGKGAASFNFQDIKSVPRRIREVTEQTDMLRQMGERCDNGSQFRWKWRFSTVSRPQDHRVGHCKA